MEAATLEPSHRTPEFCEFVQVAWGIRNLIGQAVHAGEDPRQFVDALRRVSARESAALRR